MNTYLWLIRREFWERRSFWILPAIIVGVGVFATLFGSVSLPDIDSLREKRALASTYLMSVSGAFFVVAQVQLSLYLLDCLYEDRRDRSILFWKSLPVSDTEAVLSKLLMGVIVVPLVAMAFADVAALLMALIVTVRAHDLVGGALWQPDLWLQLQVLWLYVILTTALFYLPFIGWMLVVSASVKRAPLLFSILPFLVIYLVEALFLRSYDLSHFLGRAFFGYGDAAFQGDFNLMTSADVSAGVWHLLKPGFFVSPRLWVGLAVGAALVAAAIQIRMRRTES
jgi:ABC-2 type transport system permease protein